MNCRKLNYDFVIGGTDFTLEKGWGRKGRLGFIFFYCHDKQITYHI